MSVEDVRIVRFGGRNWKVVPVSQDDYSVIPRDRVGIIEFQKGVLAYRKTEPDYDQITVLHELLHFAFPSASERDVDRADWVLKDALEAFGVDLTPLVEQPKAQKRRGRR